ncbi:MAG: hypothetical protein FJ095_03130 [Deltaproteobacteria bacterium]|nr:hypothetical protein [Deltaproteobacteria bacterium]
MALGTCGEPPAPAVPYSKPMTLAPWEGEAAGWFDDAVDPSVLGVSLDGSSPAMEAALAPRTRAAELVARVAVATISRDGNGERTRYMLTVKVVPPTLKRRGLDGDVLELRVEESAPAYATLSTYESAFRGARLMLYARRFSGESGPVLHWHLGVDSAEVATAIQLAKDLDAAEE